MKRVYTYTNLTWIDVENPTREEIFELMSQYNFSPRVADEVLVRTPRPKVDAYEDYIYLVLHFPPTTDRHGKDTQEEQEIDCIIGKESLITVHYEPIDTVLQFTKEMEVAIMLGKNTLGDHGGFLFYHLISLFYKHADVKLMGIGSSLKSIETRIFEGDENRMVKTISKLNRQLIDYRRSLRFHGLTLADLANHAPTVFGDSFTHYLNRLSREYNEVIAVLDNNKQILDDLQNTNTLLLDTKTNYTMKVLTIIAFLTVPVSIGMQFLQDYVKQLGSTPLGAILVSVFIVTFTAGLVWYFHRKKWL